MSKTGLLNNAYLNLIIQKQVEHDVKLDFILAYFSKKEDIDYAVINKSIEEKTKEALLDNLTKINDLMDRIEDMDDPMSDSLKDLLGK